MKKILYSLCMLLALWGCSSSEQLDYSALSVDFVRNKIDVGENAEILEIPVVLSGWRNDEQLEVTLQATTKDNSAVAGVDYELIDKEVTFNTCGRAYIKVKLIDNDEITDASKDFEVQLQVVTPQVKTSISTVKVFILSDDVKQEDLYSGNYTLSVQDFSDDTRYGSETGAVKISKDPDNAGHYLIHNLLLSSGNNVMSLTDKVDLYFTVDSNGNLSLPIPQNIGYDKGKGILQGLTDKGAASSEAIPIIYSTGKLQLKTPGIVGVLYNDRGEAENIYYAFKNIVLEKVN
jgi:hypothetical protein